MDSYIVVVFDTEGEATEGLHTLWTLDAAAEITVHGAAVIKRDKLGYIQVATKETHPGLRTAVGVGVGALLGAFAGPLGAAAGIAGAASIAAGSAAGIGAAAGGVLGLTGDAVKSGEHEQAAYEASFTMNAGQSAVIAEVSEDLLSPIDTAMTRIGGIVVRRAKSTVLNDSFDDNYYLDYLYPYDYDPNWA